jgi:thiol-disulfide isomerase/thioredoxin
MKNLLAMTGSILIFLTSACTLLGGREDIVREEELKSPNQTHEVELKQFGAVRGLAQSVWLNTEFPLQISDLKGKVVLIEFWTFGCANCQRMIPWLRDWVERYGEDGLVVIGYHYPEFAYEKDYDHLKDALEHLQVPYPVLQDNEGANWRADNVHTWPTLILVDKKGQIRFEQIGEVNYGEIEEAIQILLSEK